jgi:putative membrane protein
MNRIKWAQVGVFSVAVVLVFAFGLLLVGGLWGGGYGAMWPGVTDGYFGGMMDGYGGGFSGWPFMLLMCLVPFGFLAVLVVGVVWLVQAKGRSDGAESDTALEIASMRYAKGEITKEEFDQMKEAL